MSELTVFTLQIVSPHLDRTSKKLTYQLDPGDLDSQQDADLVMGSVKRFNS
jgi:hypothetical protein